MGPAANVLKRFRGNTTGVSAVEFAVLMPVMTLLLLGSFDIARAITVKSKTSQLASTISDFVSQNQTITKADLNGIVAASKTVLYPFPDTSSLLTVRVESIVDRGAPTGYVTDWYYETTAGGAVVTKGQGTDIPNPSMTPADTSTVLATVNYTYNLKFAGFLGERLGQTSFQMKSTTHNSPRWGTPVTPVDLDN
jgi:Flp pilus assembly protein TadG